jgi:hypothetical protein
MSSFFNNQALSLKFEKFFGKQLSKKKKESIQKNTERFKRLIENFEFPE